MKESNIIRQVKSNLSLRLAGEDLKEKESNTKGLAGWTEIEMLLGEELKKKESKMIGGAPRTQTLTPLGEERKRKKAI